MAHLTPSAKLYGGQVAYKTLFWFWVLYYFTKNTIGVVLRPRAAWEWIKERWHWAKLLAKFKMKIAIRYYRKVSG